jgi:hypothetical protein
VPFEYAKSYNTKSYNKKETLNRSSQQFEYAFVEINCFIEINCFVEIKFFIIPLIEFAERKKEFELWSFSYQLKSDWEMICVANSNRLGRKAEAVEINCWNWNVGTRKLGKRIKK